MALSWRPVGPLPASTYWRRRAVVVAGLILLLLVLRACTAGGDDAPDTLSTEPDGASPSPTATAAASPDPTASDVAVPAPCAADALAVEVTADREQYAVGADARFTLVVRNTGAVACTAEVGPSAVELLVRSGNDRIWSSTDCESEGEPDIRTVAPDEPVEAGVTWSGRRSLPGCTGPQAQARPGTYRVSGRLGEARSDGAVFRITG